MTKEEAKAKAKEMNEAAKEMFCPLSDHMEGKCDGIICAWFVGAIAWMLVCRFF